MSASGDIPAARAALAASEARLLETLSARLTDESACAPSRLPDWTRDMLVTHIARNADSNAQMIRAALHGEERPQYPGGPEQRTREIDAGRGRSAADLIGDVRTSAALNAEVLAEVADDQWDLVVQAGIGPRPIHQRVFGRRNEVEVHHVDLDLGYDPTHWPGEWVTGQLTSAFEAISDRYLGGGPVGTWGVGVQGVGTWAITLTDEVATVVAAAPMEPQGTAAGQARDVLAWLLGRQGGLPLTLAGNGAIADLPRWFPWG